MSTSLSCAIIDSDEGEENKKVIISHFASNSSNPLKQTNLVIDDVNLKMVLNITEEDIIIHEIQTTQQNVDFLILCCSKNKDVKSLRKAYSIAEKVIKLIFKPVVIIACKNKEEVEKEREEEEDFGENQFYSHFYCHYFEYDVFNKKSIYDVFRKIIERVKGQLLSDLLGEDVLKSVKRKSMLQKIFVNSVENVSDFFDSIKKSRQFEYSYYQKERIGDEKKPVDFIRRDNPKKIDLVPPKIEIEEENRIETFEEIEIKEKNEEKDEKINNVGRKRDPDEKTFESDTRKKNRERHREKLREHIKSVKIKDEDRSFLEGDFDEEFFSQSDRKKSPKGKNYRVRSQRRKFKLDILSQFQYYLMKEFEFVKDDLLSEKIEEDMRSIEENFKKLEDGKLEMKGLREISLFSKLLISKERKLRKKLENLFVKFGNQDLENIFNFMVTMYEKRKNYEKFFCKIEGLKEMSKELKEKSLDYENVEIFQEYKNTYVKLRKERKLLQKMIEFYEVEKSNEQLEKINVQELLVQSTRDDLKKIEVECGGKYFPNFKDEISKCFIQIKKRSHDEEKKIIESFYCPLTNELLKNPYILVETQTTFEKEAIEEYLEKNEKDPIFGKILKDKLIALKSLIEESKERVTFL